MSQNKGETSTWYLSHLYNLSPLIAEQILLVSSNLTGRCTLTAQNQDTFIIIITIIYSTWCSSCLGKMCVGDNNFIFFWTSVLTLKKSQLVKLFSLYLLSAVNLLWTRLISMGSISSFPGKNSKKVFKLLSTATEFFTIFLNFVRFLPSTIFFTPTKESCCQVHLQARYSFKRPNFSLSNLWIMIQLYVIRSIISEKGCPNSITLWFRPLVSLYKSPPVCIATALPYSLKTGKLELPQCKQDL